MEQTETLTQPQRNRISRRLLLNETHRLIYCPIEKNSCTYFKRLLIEHSPLADEYAATGLSVHDYLKKHAVLRVDEPEKILDERYLRFVVFREPLERIVSAYLNKFVRNRRSPMAVEATRQYCDHFREGEPLDRELTFAEFVELLPVQKNGDMDVHWKPQETFVMGLLPHFDWLVPMVKIPEFVDLLETRIGKPIDRQPTANRTTYQDVPHDGELEHRTPDQHRESGIFPSKESLVSDASREILERRYRRDFELYQQALDRFATGSS